MDRRLLQGGGIPMNLPGFDPLATNLGRGLSRRTTLRHLGGGGLVAAMLGAVGLERRGAAAQEATPAAATVTWQTLHLEVDYMPDGPVSIVRAGGGPPQRGDHFYNDAPIYAAGDAGGTRIGTYECFGPWTHAATEQGAPDNRLTIVQFHLDEGNLAGLINETAPAVTAGNAGSVLGGTGAYLGALGTFTQVVLPAEAGPPASPAAGGTPAAAPAVQRATFDLLLPKVG
jgi:hypothetical protein